MNTDVNPWIDVIEKAITAIATIIIAAYVAAISRRQWRTNQEKLRFDLYERRLDIYMRVFDFHGALLFWGDKPEQIALQAPFLRALQESRFMFPEKSGVYAFLKEFNGHAFHIVNYQSAWESWGDSCPQERVKLALARTDHVNWILASEGKLEERIAPYLNFHSL